MQFAPPVALNRDIISLQLYLVHTTELQRDLSVSLDFVVRVLPFSHAVHCIWREEYPIKENIHEGERVDYKIFA